MANIKGYALLAACALSVGTSPTLAQTGSVLYLVPALTDEYYIGEIEAAKARAKDFSSIEFEFTAAGTNRDPIPEMIARIEAAVTRGVDAIVIDAGEAAGGQIVPALEKAQAAGVKVVVVAVPIPELARPDAQVLFDDHEGALPGGQYIAEKLKSGDKIVFIRCAIGNVQMDARANGLLDGFKGSGIQVVATADAHCDPLEARSHMENWLTAYPDIKGVLSDTDIALVGALEALEASLTDLVVVGHDAQSPVVKRIAERSIVDATVILPNRRFGELGVETAAGLLEGQSFEKPIIVPPAGIVTQDNVEDFLKENPLPAN